MLRICPSCKMESAEDANWCDFCKEPFRKAKMAVEPAPAPAPAPVPAPAAPPAGGKITEEELLKRLPPEFIKGDDGLRVPTLPRWLTWVAAVFLFFWLIVGAIMGFQAVDQMKRAPLPGSSPIKTLPSR